LKQEKFSGFARFIGALILDMLLAGVILVVFSFFHHVLPMIRRESASASLHDTALQEQIDVSETAESTESMQTAPDAEIQEEELRVEIPDKTETIDVVDNRTEWQKKFEDKFSENVISDGNTYKSPNISIEVETIEIGEGNSKVTYHVADIYIASIENFATYTAHNEVVYFDAQDALEMDIASNALVSMTGDFITYQQSGLFVRNGELIMDDYSYGDICVMYYDGTVETYLMGTYVKEDILARDPYQIWNFGPMFLNEEGKAMTTFNTSSTVAQINPRSAFGYFEPGHYCFVVVDGRQNGYSAGMTLPELAQVFEDLGCKAAYNLDGGGSALMMFNHERYSQMSNGGERELGDLLLIRETEAAE